MNSTNFVFSLSVWNLELINVNNILSEINLYLVAYVDPVTIALTVLTNVAALLLLAARSKSLGLSPSMHLYYVAIETADLCTVFGSHLWDFLGTRIAHFIYLCRLLVAIRKSHVT